MQVSLALKTAVFLSSCSKSTKLAVLVNWVADPVNSRVVANSSVSWVNQNDLKVLVDSILIDPVRVQHAKSTTFTSYTLLSDTAEVSDRLQLGDTLVDWLSVHNTLRHNRFNRGETCSSLFYKTYRIHCFERQPASDTASNNNTAAPPHDSKNIPCSLASYVLHGEHGHDIQHILV